MRVIRPRYGAPPVHPEFEKAGATGSQHYLNLVAEGRVTPVPWMSGIDGSTLTFTDGTEQDIDTIIIGTGFHLNLPFLSQDIAATVNLTPKGLDLHQFTFHPDLPGLAFLGLWSQQGSYPTVLEQQARYIAYFWSGLVDEPASVQREGVLACVEEGHHQDYRSQNEMALRFARLCGADPAGHVDPELAEIIKASATTSLLYRLVGPDAFPDGAEKLATQFETYGPPKQA